MPRVHLILSIAFAIFMTVAAPSARADVVSTAFSGTPETQAYILAQANGAGCGCTFKEGKLGCESCQKPECAAKLKSIAERDLHSSENGQTFFYRTGMTTSPLADLNLGSCRGHALAQWVQDSDGLSEPRPTQSKDVLDCWSFLASNLAKLAAPEKAQCDTLRGPEYQSLRYANQSLAACCVPREAGKKPTAQTLDLENKCLAPRAQIVTRAMNEFMGRISAMQVKWAPASVLSYACRDNTEIRNAAEAGLTRVDSEFGEKFYTPAMKTWSAARALPADLKISKNGMPEGVPELPDMTHILSRDAAEAALAPAHKGARKLGLQCVGPGCKDPTPGKKRTLDQVVEEVDACVVQKLRATADQCPKCAVKIDSACDQLGALMNVLGGENGIAASSLAEAVQSPGVGGRASARAWDYRRLRIKNYFGHLRQEFVGDLMKSARRSLREKGLSLPASSSCAQFPEIRAIVQGEAPAISELSDDETLNIIQHAAEIKSGLLIHELYRMQLDFQRNPTPGGICPVGQPYSEWKAAGAQAKINCTRPEDREAVRSADELLVKLLGVGFDPYLRAGMDESSFTAIDGKLDLSMFPMVQKVNDRLGLGEDPLARYSSEMQGLSRAQMAKDPRVQSIKKLLQGEGRELMRKDLRAGLETVCDGDSWRRLLDMPGIVSRVKNQGCANDGLFPVIDACSRQVLAQAEDRQQKASIGIMGGCLIGGFVPVINVAVGAACIPAFLGMAAHDVGEASANKDLAVACTITNGCALDQAIEKIQKLTEAKNNARLQVALVVLQAAGPTIKAGKTFVANLRTVEGFEKLTPAAQASVERLSAALSESTATNRAKPFEATVEEFLKEDGTYERGFDRAAKQAAEAVKAGRFGDATGLPRRWVSKVMSGGVKDAFLLESPAGAKQVFPQSEHIPKELWGKPIDGWFVKMERPGIIEAEARQYFTAGEAAMDKALPEILKDTPRWKVEPSLKVKGANGTELIFQRASLGKDPLLVAEEIFGSLTKNSVHDRGDTLKNLIVKISNPKYAPCFRGVKLEACEQMFASLTDSGVDAKKIQALIQTDKKAGNFASLLEEAAAKVDHEGRALQESRESPLNEVFFEGGMIKRDSRLYWEPKFDLINHRPDLNLGNFRIHAVGDNFEAYIFDAF